MFTATVSNIRTAEAKALQNGRPEYELMQAAGRGAAACIRMLLPKFSRLVFLAGGGNNGGDALAVASGLQDFPAVIYALKPHSELKGCAALAAADLPAHLPYHVREKLTAADFLPGDLIVDGVLGIGFNGSTLKPAVAGFLRAANDSGLPIIALDIPSGLNADSGEAVPETICAAMTLTFGGVKPGLCREDGPRCRGALRLIDIGLELPDADEEASELFTNIDAVKIFPRTAFDVHKNSRGRVLICGGSPTYYGAPVLAAKSALYGGAGLVRICSEADLRYHLPAAMIFRHLQPGEKLPPESTANCDAIAAGCGWGDVPLEQLQPVIDAGKPLVLDADGLNALAKYLPAVRMPRANKQTVLTPHRGEAERLCRAAGLNPAAPPETMAAALAEYFGAVVLLKGPDTVVSDGIRTLRVTAGSPALATAGSGDVLSGLIGALLARGLAGMEAAALGAYIHGVAGEIGGIGITADELPELIRQTSQKIAERRIF